MKILSIDTSCDETSVAVTEGVRVLSNTISSQVRYHKKYGGVVPMLAGRLHAERIESVIAESLQTAGITEIELEAIAVTYGPGLAPALQVGIATATAWAERLDLPLYGVNHMKGHIVGCFAQVGSKMAPLPKYPALVVLMSGSHSELVRMDSFTEYHILGQTLDDALGEAYDKVGRMLGLGYPGGKLVAKLAQQGNSTVYSLPIPMQRSGNLNLSYSGLKNAVRLLIDEEKPLNLEKTANIAASFERSAQQSVVDKVKKALAEYPDTQQLLLGGGVAANSNLRSNLRAVAKEFEIPFLTPPNLKLCTDNAGMIGVAAYFGIEAGQQPVEEIPLDRVPYLSLEN